jgi:SAM-dependent methyltransferase
MATVPRRLTFGAHADAYERARPAWPEAAARWLVPDGAELVVELGAGTGKLTRAVSALGTRVVAVEPDPRMLAVLRGLGLEGVEGSAEAIPFDDGVADGVVAGSSLHWFELEHALPEIHRVLRPGGRFAFGWNHRDDRQPAIARMGEAVYSPQPRRRGPRWRSRDWPAELTGSGLFRDVEHALFAHVHELPREALADHLLSYSGVAALPEVERRRVIGRVAEALDSDPSLSDGVTLRLPFVVAAYRATRIGQGSSKPTPPDSA